MSRPIHLYYHVYLCDDGSWAHILLEHFKLMEDIKLLERFDKIEVNMVTPKQDSRSEICMDMLKDYHPNISFSTFNGGSENITISKIWLEAQNSEFSALYLHSKGVTATANHLYTGNASTFKNYYYWRQFLNWGVIEEYIAHLGRIDHNFYRENIEVSGVNYFSEPAPHFSGAFWWARSDYLRRLPDPRTLTWWHKLKEESTDPWLRTADDRFRDEMWILSDKSAKIWSRHNLSKVTNLSTEILHRKDYKNVPIPMPVCPDII